MDNFTKTSMTMNGISRVCYLADRLRGGAVWVFFAEAPHDTVYSPTWPHEVEGAPTFEGISFISMMSGDEMRLCFNRDLSIAEETALDGLYAAHVAPVPV
jgi:hypothetical protein